MDTNFNLVRIWLLFHPCRLPWNNQTPFGYLAEICFVLVACASYIYVNGTMLLLFISIICLHHKVFSEEFHLHLLKLNHPDGIPNHKAFLAKIIQFHNSTKGWLRLKPKVMFFSYPFQVDSSPQMVFRNSRLIQHLYYHSFDLWHDLYGCCSFSIGFGNPLLRIILLLLKLKNFMQRFVLLHFSRNLNTSTLISVYFWQLLCKVGPIYLSIVFLENWLPTAMNEWISVRLNPIGKPFRWNCKNISFSWLEIHRNHFITMDSKL